MEVKQVSKNEKLVFKKIEKKLAEKQQKSNIEYIQINIHYAKATKTLYFFGKKC